MARHSADWAEEVMERAGVHIKEAVNEYKRQRDEAEEALEAIEEAWGGFDFEKLARMGVLNRAQMVALREAVEIVTS